MKLNNDNPTANQASPRAFSHGDEVSYNGRPYRFGSSAGYAKEYGEDPQQARKEAKEKGHPLAWIVAQSMIMHGDRAHAKQYAEALLQRTRVEPGDIVNVEGETFVIVAEPNRNLGLRPR